MHVLAGYIAPVQSWAAFSAEWELSLNEEPRISYFKYREARSLVGEFAGWSETNRDAKVKKLTSIVNKYAVAGVSVWLQNSIYEQYFSIKDAYGQKMYSPYFILFYELMRRFVDIKPEQPPLLPPNWELQFLFDEQPGQLGLVMDAWEAFKWQKGEKANSLKVPPVFGNDLHMLPIQAADMHAWFVRKNLALGLERGPDGPEDGYEEVPGLRVPCVGGWVNLDDEDYTACHKDRQEQEAH